MPFIQKPTMCLECQMTFIDCKKLSHHLKKVHKMTYEQYVIKFKYGGTRPLCPNCGEQTRFMQSFDLGFKKYCSNCAKVAMSNGGKIGGVIKQTWNTGQTKENNPLVARMARSITGENNPMFGVTLPRETIENIRSKNRNTPEEMNDFLKKKLPNTVILNFDEYVNQSTMNLKIKCNVCNTINTTSYFNIKRCWRCHTCHPLGSRPQLEIFDYVKSLGFEASCSDRTIIRPYELDIWVPSKNIAIEFNGLYWHALANLETIDHKRHFIKREMCEQRGIQLIQIYSDEWELQPELVKAFLKSSFSIDTRKCSMQDCRFIGSSNNEFLNEYHLGPFREDAQIVDIVSNVDDRVLGSFNYHVDDTVEEAYIVSHAFLPGIEVPGVFAAFKEFSSVDRLFLFSDADKLSIDSTISQGFSLLHTEPATFYLEGHYRSFERYSQNAEAVQNSGVRFLVL